MQQKAEPEIFDKAYTGMGAEGGGVVGMLEVIESDFARLESDTKASEASAQKDLSLLFLRHFLVSFLCVFAVHF